MNSIQINSKTTNILYAAHNTLIMSLSQQYYSSIAFFVCKQPKSKYLPWPVLCFIIYALFITYAVQPNIVKTQSLVLNSSGLPVVSKDTKCVR